MRRVMLGHEGWGCAARSEARGVDTSFVRRARRRIGRGGLLLVLGAAWQLSLPSQLVAQEEEGPAPREAVEQPEVMAADEPSEAASATEPRPLAITISGAASLGSYEGGYAHYLIESLRGSRVAAPRAFVGTSAGSINSLLGLLAACGRPAADPRESLFWQTWMPVGVEGLYAPDEVRATSLFTRRGFAHLAAPLEALFAHGLPESCDMLLGAAVTRVRPATQGQGGALAMPRMAERFLLRVRGRGVGAPIEVANERLPSLGLPRLAVEGGDGAVFEAVRDLLFASSAFPGGFAPQDVPICDDDDVDAPCTAARARRVPFLDGGFFDTHPLNLALWALRDGEGRTPDDALFVLVNPVLRSYPEPRESLFGVSVDEVPETMVPYVVTLVEGFALSAMTMSLQEALAHEPGLRERLHMSSAAHPPTSDPLFMFLGFFEQTFRRFDFYLGMLHARHALDELRAQGGALEGVVPLEDAMASDAEGWRPYHCLRAMLDGVGDESALCAGDDLAPYRALAHVARERVYDACQPERIGEDPARREAARRHRDCARALDGHAPPGAAEGWRRGRGEAALRWMFRRMGARGLAFEDLDDRGRRGEAGGLAAYGAFRDKLAGMARGVAVRQGLLAPLAEPVAQTMVDMIAYRPERHDLYLTLGGVVGELGWSFTGRRVPRLRGTIVLEGRGFDTLFSSAPPWAGFAPLAGFEVEPLAPFDGALQIRLGLRAGYLFSSRDRFGTGECEDDTDRVRPCSRLVTQATLTAIGFHLVRFAVVGEWAPPLRESQAGLWAIRPEVGVQLFWE